MVSNQQVIRMKMTLPRPFHQFSRLAFAAFVLIFASPSPAAIVEIANKALWQASAGPTSFRENFDSFAVDTPFRIADGPLSLNGFSIVETGSVSQSLNLIDLPPLINTTNDVNGTPFASLATDYGRTDIEIHFSQPARAFGGEFNEIKSPEVMVIDFFEPGGTLITTVDPAAIVGFVGFVATGSESIGYIRMRNTVDMGTSIREAFGLDNFEIVSVPEPGTGVSVASLSATLVALRARRKQFQATN
jgi:hypothetical protein